MDPKITFGSTASKLRANGYSPRALNGDDSYRCADHAAVVLCSPRSGGSIAALTVCVRDKAVRADLVALLARHGVGKGPVRTDTAEYDAYIVSVASPMFSRQTNPYTSEVDPALAFDCLTRAGNGNDESATVRIDGTWRNSTLLETSRDKLPSLDEEGVKTLFSVASALIRKNEPRREYMAPPLTEAQIQHRAKTARLDAELEKRNDPDIMAEVRNRLERLPGLGTTPVDIANHRAAANDIERRIAVYDEILARRTAAADSEARRAARYARQFGAQR